MFELRIDSTKANAALPNDGRCGEGLIVKTMLGQTRPATFWAPARKPRFQSSDSAR